MLADVPLRFRIGSGFLRKDVLIVLALGLVIRYVVGFFLTYTYDVHSWALIISNFESGNGLYDVAGHNYTPTWGYVLGTFSVVAEALGLDVAEHGESAYPAFSGLD